MLVSLAIHDLAVIEDTTLELSPGLNVLTGETGAGKSMILEALSLVLGDRAELELVRRGRERAEVTALFRLAADGAVLARLQEHALTDADEPLSLLIRRVVAPQGKGRAYINGRIVTVSTLAEVTRGLVDLSSQHQHTQLLDPSAHLELLDRFGGLLPQRATFAKAWGTLSERRRALADLQQREQERARREDFVRFQLSEIDEVDPVLGEEDQLEAERARLSHADRLLAGSEEVRGLVSRESGSASERLVHALRSLDRLVGFDAELEPLRERLAALRIDLDDVGDELGAYAAKIDLDPRRLDHVTTRLEALKKLRRKYGPDLAAVIAAREVARAELDQFDSLALDIGDAERALQAAEREARSAAQVLSKARRATKATLETRVSAELADLAMGGAEIRFELAARDAASTDGALGPDGLESGELYLQANRGEGFAPLAKTASGGELARVLLALKRALLAADPVETCVFDEVDAGTGGAVGDRIGLKLAEIAATRQVLCITHLPQIAARGATHLMVVKETAADRTRTHIVRLDQAARVEELARMLGGLDITAKTRAHARELLARRA